jgi:predicted transcriptional regulator
MHAPELVKLAMEKTGKTSQHQIAEVLGVSHVAVGKWLRGENCPTFEQAAELALLAGLPPVSTAAEVRQHSKDGANHKALLRRMAQIAAAVVLTTSITAVKAENVVKSAGYNDVQSTAVYIMRNYGCGATLPVLAIFLIRTGTLARLP